MAEIFGTDSDNDLRSSATREVDLIQGRFGNDQIRGSAGDDVLYGEIEGELTSETLGDSDNDVLQGDAGSTMSLAMLELCGGTP
jgi:hypothetical protein